MNKITEITSLDTVPELQERFNYRLSKKNRVFQQGSGDFKPLYYWTNYLCIGYDRISIVYPTSIIPDNENFIINFENPNGSGTLWHRCNYSDMDCFIYDDSVYPVKTTYDLSILNNHFQTKTVLDNI